jgi:hypothetical protein
MGFFKPFDDDSVIGDIYRFEPRIWKHFAEFSRELMRGPSPLTPGERELVAGYVSGRLIHGHGIKANPDVFRERGERVASKTHQDWKDQISTEKG